MKGEKILKGMQNKSDWPKYLGAKDKENEEEK